MVKKGTRDNMEKGEHLKRQNRPTMLQLKYLQGLSRVEKKRGTQGSIAEYYNVNRSTVNRFFKNCIERGILTEALEFTVEGNELDQEIQNNLQKCERHPVVFRLYRMNKKPGQSRDSMAMRGFEETAEIVQDKGESYLELKVKDMSAHSRVRGETMVGKLKTLKYEHDEVLETDDIVNNIVRIPMEACKIHKWTGVGTMGVVPVTVTCSVGLVHMPESTALLYFWV